jgi:arabinose-5-phosphate isomerase
MSRKRLGMTAVVDADQTLLGIFTDGDLRRALDTVGLDIHSTSIASVMTRNPVTIGAQALATEAARLLETRNIGSGLIVVDAERRVIGALNVHDLLRARVV